MKRYQEKYRLIIRHLRYASIAMVMVISAMASPAIAILQKGETAPPIDVVSTSGQAISLANYKGYVLLLDFFASWCEPCRNIIPHLNELNGRFGSNGLQILGLSVDEAGDKAALRFISERKFTYPVAFAGEKLQTEYGLRSIPAIFLISKKGVVAEKYNGYSESTRKSMEAAIRRLLAE